MLDVAVPCELFSWMKDNVATTLAVIIPLVSPTRTPVTARGALLLIPDHPMSLLLGSFPLAWSHATVSRRKYQGSVPKFDYEET